jgi:hypothetical protein
MDHRPVFRCFGVSAGKRGGIGNLIFEISKGSGWGRQMAGWQSRKVSGFMAKTARKGKKMGAKGKVAHTLRFSTI